MLHFKEFSAWVTIDGAPVEEHGVEVSEDNRTVTCWIQSEEGKAFEINANDDKRTTATSIYFYVDGKKIPHGRVLHSGSRKKTGCKKRGFRISPTLVKRFEFGRLNVTDDDDAVTGSASQEVGEIKVTMVRTRIMGPKSGSGREVKLPPEVVFHEKSKKGVLGAHQTRFGTETFRPEGRVLRCKDYGPVVATFCFRYQPLSVLQAQGIIQLPPSLKRPVSDVIDISDDDSDELERLRARVKELEAQRPQKKVKQEPKVQKISAFIDLT